MTEMGWQAVVPLEAQGERTVDVLKEIVGDHRFPEGTAWRRHYFQPNQTVIREGEPGHSLYFIEAGTLRVSGRVELESQRHVQPGICDLGSGELFGEICLYQPHPRSATVMALTESQVLELDGQRLTIYLDAHPVQGYLFLRELFETVASRLHRANVRVENLFAWGLKAHAIEKYL